MKKLNIKLMAVGALMAGALAIPLAPVASASYGGWGGGSYSRSYNSYHVRYDNDRHWRHNDDCKRNYWYSSHDYNRCRCDRHDRHWD